MRELTKKEANLLIAEKLEEANEALQEAAQLADSFGLTFMWDGPYGYGSSNGGEYKSIKAYMETNNVESEDDVPEYDDRGARTHGWISSDEHC